MQPCSLRSLCASVVRHWRSSCSIIRLGEGPLVKCAAWCEEPWRSHTDLYVCSWIVDARALIAVSADGSLTLVLLAYPSLMKVYLLSAQGAWRSDVLTDPYVCSWIVDARCTDHLVCWQISDVSLTDVCVSNVGLLTVVLLMYLCSLT